MRYGTHLLTAVTMLVLPATVLAQAPTCRDGSQPEAWLGISGFQCNCTLDTDAGLWSFRSEPRVLSVADEGPAANQLRPGDVIVAVDGLLITTTDGGRRFSSVKPGQAVKLTVRRGGRLQETRVITGQRCRGDEETAVVARSLSGGIAVSPDATARVGVVTRARRDTGGVVVGSGDTVSRAARVAEAREAEIRTRVQEAQTVDAARRKEAQAQLQETRRADSMRTAEARADVARAGKEGFAGVMVPHQAQEAATAAWAARQGSAGWFGFGISCGHCGMSREDGNATWFFNDPPQVYSVDPGTPAARAGLRRGDQLLAIDGSPLTSDAGARRFSEVRPGQTVTFRYQRDGMERTVRLTAVARGSRAQTEQLTRQIQEMVQQIQESSGQSAELNRQLKQLQEKLQELSVQNADQAAQLSRIAPRAEAYSTFSKAAKASTAPNHLRYSGVVGNTAVEVRGGSVVVTIIEPGKEIEIVTGDSRIRLRAEGASTKK